MKQNEQSSSDSEDELPAETTATEEEIVDPVRWKFFEKKKFEEFSFFLTNRNNSTGFIGSVTLENESIKPAMRLEKNWLGGLE